MPPQAEAALIAELQLDIYAGLDEAQAYAQLNDPPYQPPAPDGQVPPPLPPRIATEFHGVEGLPNRVRRDAFTELWTKARS